jgi:thiol-disulfide isomerase/thioredoxin
MKTKNYILLIIVALFFSISCDKLEEPYAKDNVFIWNGRKMLVLDFTGHTCGNCPRAHETIDLLIEEYGEAIVPVAIHSTWYAKPSTTDTTLPFNYDFRTDVGDYLGGRDLETGFYGELFLPVGLINNLAVENLKVHGSWATEIALLASTYPEYLINIEPAYTETDSLISCEIDITTNIGNSRKLALNVLILEDHIMQWQKDYSLENQDIEGYDHKHVLRAGINGAFGEIIKDNTDASVIDDQITKSYSYKAGEDWVVNNCIIVAFVYDYDTKEVLQAEMIHINE